MASFDFWTSIPDIILWRSSRCASFDLNISVEKFLPIQLPSMNLIKNKKYNSVYFPIATEHFFIALVGNVNVFIFSLSR